MANKKSLSESEIYARCRNKHEQKHLRDKLNDLSEEEFSSMDFLKMEINRWRQFRRDNVRNSGWSGVSKCPAKRDKTLLSKTMSPFASSNTGQGIDQFQQPWVYSYQSGSHNRTYQDLLQSSTNLKTSLRIRHQSAKASVVAKLSTSSSLGSETLQNTTNDENKSNRYLDRSKSARLCSDRVENPGNFSTHYNPKMSFFIRTPRITEDDILERKKTCASLTLSEAQNYMRLKSCSPSTRNTQARSLRIRKNMNENASTEFREGNISPSSNYNDQNGEVVVENSCRNRKTRGERRSKPYDHPDTRLKANLKESNKTKTLRSPLGDKAHTGKDRLKLSSCNVHPALEHDSLSDSNRNRNRISNQEKRKCRHSSTPISDIETKADNKSIPENSEDILASSLPLWASPQRLSENQIDINSLKHHNIDQRSKQIEIKPTIGNVTNGFHVNESIPQKIQLFQSFELNKNRPIPKRRYARDESIIPMEMLELRGRGNQGAMDVCGSNNTLKENNVSKEKRTLPTLHRHNLESLSSLDKKQRVQQTTSLKRTNFCHDGLPFANRGVSDNNSFKDATPEFRGDLRTTHSLVMKNRKPDSIGEIQERIPLLQSRKEMARANRSERKRLNYFLQKGSPIKDFEVIENQGSVNSKTKAKSSQQIQPMSRYKVNRTITSMTGAFEKTHSILNGESDSDQNLKGIDIKIPTAVLDDITFENPSESVQTMIGLQTEHISLEERDNLHSDDYIQSSKKDDCIKANENAESLLEQINDNLTMPPEDKEKISLVSRLSSDKCAKTKNEDKTKSGSSSESRNENVTDSKENNVEEQLFHNQSQDTKNRAASASPTTHRNGNVYYKGILLSNYISPEQRYKIPHGKRQGSHDQLDGRSQTFVNPPTTRPYSHVISLNYSKQARQQALAQLVERNHANRSSSIQRALTESLQTRIKEFCFSLDPYRQSTV